MTKDDARVTLSQLNEAVNSAVDQRTAFLDAHMHLFAEFSLGEAVALSGTGEHTTVTEHYRYHADQGNTLLDNDFSVECRFANGDNTSRYAGLHPYVAAPDYEARTEKLFRALQRSSRR